MRILVKTRSQVTHKDNMQNQKYTDTKMTCQVICEVTDVDGLPVRAGVQFRVDMNLFI